MIERKAVDLDVKAADGGMASAYVSVFNNIDRQGEIVAPGAFTNLDEFVKSGWVAVNHEWDDLPVASVATATQDDYGLKLVWDWHSTDDAQACRTVVRERMERGKAVKCSIGYRVVKDRMDEIDGKPVRVLEQVELYEASIVNRPANPKAEVTAVKAWHQDYDDAMRALKEGRVLSSRNRQRLAAMCERMKETVAEVEQLLAETDPTPSGEDGWGDKPKSADALREAAAFEAFRAKYPFTLPLGVVA